jgi:hypothetical protein
MKRAASRLLTRQDSCDSTRLCWCVRTAAAALVRKPQSVPRLCESDWLDWTRLGSVGVHAPAECPGTGIGGQMLLVQSKMTPVTGALINLFPCSVTVYYDALPSFTIGSAGFITVLKKVNYLN